MTFFQELKSLLGLLALFAALVIFVLNDMPESLVWATVAAIAGLSGFEIIKRNGVNKK